MCMALPAEVLEVDGKTAIVRIHSTGIEKQVTITKEVKTGDDVLVFQNIALLA